MWEAITLTPRNQREHRSKPNCKTNGNGKNTRYKTLNRRNKRTQQGTTKHEPKHAAKETKKQRRRT